ncbi:hypothetical protein M2347_004175 [Chryseobacterium sp. H1D6B]|nr:hypothetical protein [Chryseobacterium sp. H1D6B]
MEKLPIVIVENLKKTINKKVRAVKMAALLK